MALHKYFSSKPKRSREDAVIDDGESSSDEEVRFFASESDVAQRTGTSSDSADSDEDVATPQRLPTRLGQTSSSSGAISRSGSDRSKQSGKFQTEWLAGRKWLQYDDERKGMLCVLCQKYDQKPYNRDVWNKVPCTRMRLHSIRRHEKSGAHRDSINKERLALRPAESVPATINPPLSAESLLQAFSCLYFLLKQRIAHTTNFEPLLDLFEFLGVHIKAGLRVAKNALYTSDQSIQEMVYVLSEVVEKKILKSIRESNHFALMIDETTDCTVTEQLAIHGRFICKSTGQLRSHFLTVIDLLHREVANTRLEESSCIRAGAETVTKRVMEYVEGAGLDINKLRGIGTDGASTMTGVKTGVVARLKVRQPSLIGVHCAAHRVNLASTQRCSLCRVRGNSDFATRGDEQDDSALRHEVAQC
ncbi:zinc finger protein 862-like [Oscarella lobularis]|uniref:zinc finger protein 862-like n=1 Tax=Oscarella lobularis TaxID=121494 RepID=UPI0033144DA6